MRSDFRNVVHKRWLGYLFGFDLFSGETTGDIL